MDKLGNSKVLEESQYCFNKVLKPYKTCVNFISNLIYRNFFIKILKAIDIYLTKLKK